MKYFVKIILLSFLVACTVDNASTYKKQYVVQAYLIANKTLPQIRLSTTVAPGEKYVQIEVAVDNADVEIQLLNNDGTIGKIFPYHYDYNGIYLPLVNAIIEPGRTYRLRVSFPGKSQVVSAETTVPKTFKIVKTINDSVTYKQAAPVKFVATTNPEIGNAKYLFNVIAQNPLSLTPYYQHQLDLDPNKTPDWYINVESGILNESNFTILGNGDIELILPWDTIAFYGQNAVMVNVIDKNLYDFLRSVNTSDSNKQLASGYLNEIIYHIDGGIGIFGSMARDSALIYVTK